MIRRSLVVFGTISVVLLAMINFVYAQDAGPQSPDAPQALLGTAFTYQGQLKSGGSPANGTFDLLFRLYATESGGSPLGSLAESADVTVTNGYFATQIDFGANAFNGEARWLGVWVRPGASTGAYTALTPRQPLTPAPYALALPGLYTQPNATSPNIIGGYSGNVISATMVGGVIGGGGADWGPNRVQADHATIGGGVGNTASGERSTIGGGYSNIVSDLYATIGGGYNNTVGGDRATVGGGSSNIASGNDATVGGGDSNTASGSNATIAGGWSNDSLDDNATVGGGVNNVAGGYASTVPGGYGNTASGYVSFAAGQNANAVHPGAFVWADAINTPFTSTLSNQFLVRAGGGVGINTSDTSANALTVNGQVIAGGVGVPTGSTEPFIARGNSAGLSLDDRSVADARWVVYANSGLLRFWNGVERMSVSGAGVLTVGALGSAGGTALCRNASNQIAVCSSSIRYKDNISALDLGLETVAQLRPVTFDWTGTGDHDLGFVAEEVAEVTPLLTTRNAEGQIEGVKYDRVSAVLVKAVQEQQQQIDDLKHQNADLQTRLANLDQTAPSSAFNVFNLLSVITGGGFIYLLIQQRRSKRSL